MSDIEVAVVIVTYRSAELAIECLRSLHAEREAQSLRLRVVVVDNASGDLPQIAQAVERSGWSAWVTPLLAPKNGGFAYGNNLGIRHVYEQGRPDYVYLLNPDTQVRKGAIGALVGFLESHPEAGIAGSSFETEDGSHWPFAFRFPGMASEIEHGMQTGIVTRLLSRWTASRVMDSTAEAVDWVSGASMMIRPAVFAAVGCLDENFFLYYEETEFCHRARRAGFATWYVPQSRVMHMIGKSTNVDEESRFNRPMPGYWYDSRARYYAVTHGLASAAAIDVAAMLAGVWGLLKRKLLRRRGTPRYVRDLLAHSALLPKNRSVAPHKSYFPPAP